MKGRLAFLFAACILFAAIEAAPSSKLQGKASEDKTIIVSNELIDHERDRRQSTSYSTEEILAQAVCQASTAGTQYERVYAVGRSCTASTGNCDHICSSTQLHNQDPQTANHRWSCISAFHVYYRRPATIKNGNFNTARLGLKTMRRSCTTSNCGPNFCCCMSQP